MKTKKDYGEFLNVKLTDEEYEKLQMRFPEDYNDRIDDLSYYIESKGDKYKSHYSTILLWDRRDKKRGMGKPGGILPPSSTVPPPLGKEGMQGRRDSAPVMRRNAFNNFEQKQTDYTAVKERSRDKLLQKWSEE